MSAHCMQKSIWCADFVVVNICLKHIDCLAQYESSI